eukprot:7534171-Lingulodinium_polyedra.AAC.1
MASPKHFDGGVTQTPVAILLAEGELSVCASSERDGGEGKDEHCWLLPGYLAFDTFTARDAGTVEP